MKKKPFKTVINLDERLGAILRRRHLAKEFQKKLITWYDQNGRAFYWRTHSLDGWQWLVLELLLKRTRAETVEKRFPSLIAKYSQPSIVVRASNRELEKDLECLGLQRQRSRALKLIAEIIVNEYHGQVPFDQNSLAAIPHVGLYLSNAVLCFCYGQRRPIVDNNVARILTRFMGLNMPSDAREKWIWDLAERMLPAENWKKYNYGLLDLGALICKKKSPCCAYCCVEDICTYARKGRIKAKSAGTSSRSAPAG